MENEKRKQITKMPSRGFDKCQDCEKLILKDIDQNTYNRMQRCYHCQINFEADLKNMKIGEKNNKHYFWVKLQMLRRWASIDKEIEELTLYNRENKFNDSTLTNALANYNQELTRESIKRTT